MSSSREETRPLLAGEVATSTLLLEVSQEEGKRRPSQLYQCKGSPYQQAPCLTFPIKTLLLQLRAEWLLEFFSPSRQGPMSIWTAEERSNTTIQCTSGSGRKTQGFQRGLRKLSYGHSPKVCFPKKWSYWNTEMQKKVI